MVFLVDSGLDLACAFGILNAMWFELREGEEHDPAKLAKASERT